MTKKKTLSINDKFFKASMQDHLIAKDFFKAHLPQRIQRVIDWQALNLESVTFIDENDESRFTDILYSQPTQPRPVELVKRLHSEACQMIALYGGFGSIYIAKVKAAMNDAIAVVPTMCGPEDRKVMLGITKGQRSNCRK